MKTIAIMSPKGGIGKTTTTVSLSYLLGVEHNKKVLVLEGDSQGDTTKTYGAYDLEDVGMSELLEEHISCGGSYHTSDLVQGTKYDNIDIIPGNDYLMQTDLQLMQQDNNITRLRDALLEVSHLYDYCICDCGRLFNLTVLNMLMVADLIIAPVKVGGYELIAIDNLIKQTTDIQELNPNVKIKLLMTMRQKNKTSMEIEEKIRSGMGLDMFSTAVRRSIMAEKSTNELRPLPEFSKRGIVTQDYREVAEELLRDMEG